jgi:hypothetical protein
MLIMRGSKDKSKLKTISGELELYEIVRIPGSKYMIDIMSLKIKGHEDKVALYLNSKKEYLPLFEKFKISQPITIIYNDKGREASKGFNLHIYEIVYGNEIIYDYVKKTTRDKIIGIILYFFGLIFCIPLYYATGQKS